MTAEHDFDVRLQRWLDAREAPMSANRVSEEILSALATVPQERRLIRLGRRPVRRPPLRLLGVAAALLIAGGLAAVVGLGSRPSVVLLPDPTPTASPTSRPNLYPQVVRQIDLGADTWQVLATPAKVWVQADDVGVQGIDPSTGLESGTVDGGSWMFLEGDELWVQKGAELVLVRVDPVTGRELERFEGIPGFTVAKDGDTVWGFDEPGNVVQVDMATGDVLGSVDVPEEPKQIVLAADSVWVICDAGSALVRIDPETYDVVDTVDVGLGPVELELGFDSLWVRNRQLELVRVDPETAEVIATIDGFGTSPSLGLSFGGGYVWASVSGPAGMGAIDPSTNAVAYEIPLPGVTYMDSYWLDGTLWVTTAFDQQLLQVDAASP
jgi:streptogramin lyase